MKLKVIVTLLTTFFYIISIAQTVNEVSPPPPLDSINSIFSKVEVEAQFPGGTYAWIEYLKKNLKANVPVKKRPLPEHIKW